MSGPDQPCEFCYDADSRVRAMERKLDEQDNEHANELIEIVVALNGPDDVENVVGFAAAISRTLANTESERDAAQARCERLTQECEAWREVDNASAPAKKEVGFEEFLELVAEARRLRAENEGEGR